MHSLFPTICDEQIPVIKSDIGFQKSREPGTHTVHGNPPLRSREQVFVQLLQECRLGNGAAEVVNEDGGRAVGLQQRPEEPLQEGDELLVLPGLAHLGGREWEAQLWGDRGTPLEHPQPKKAVPHCPTQKQPTAPWAHNRPWRCLLVLECVLYCNC